MMSTNSQPKIRAVVFDLDGVYFESGTENFIKFLETEFSLTRDEIVAVYFKSKQIQQLKSGEMTDQEFWDYAIETWKIDSTRDELVEALLSGYSVNPDVEAFVSDLRKRGIKTAICTNNFPDRFEGLRERFSLNDRFDVIITSYETGVVKPDPQIFLTLAEALSLRPDEILMSDDREINADALKKLGFNAFLYTDWESFKDSVEALIY